MAFQCNELEYCKLNVHYTVEGDVVRDQIDDTVRRLQKSNVKVPGSRPGRATELAIRVHLKEHIEKTVKSDLVAKAYDEILYETKMKPIGYPQILNSELDGNRFLCDLLFLKKPDFELKEYKGFEIPRPHQGENVEQMTERLLQQLREFHGDVIPYSDTDFVQPGDQVTMDIKCECEGQQVDGLTREGFMYQVGGQMLPGFSDNLLGMKAGEDRQFELTLDGSAGEEFVNKTGSFLVTVHMGTKKIPCPLNDELATKAGFPSLGELQKAATGRASSNLQTSEKQQLGQQVISRLVANHDFQVPAWLVTMEAQRLAADNKINWEELKDESKEFISQQAEQQVKLSLILDSVRDAEPDVSFSNMELLGGIKSKLMAQGYDERSAEGVIKNGEKTGALYGMMAQLRDDVTLQWLLDQCKIVD